ncbi:MAG: hypothetical protein JNL81_01490 [Hyphomonadaceae bacterium]|nr:hypothetical protein [Hyphomonadaceae bacterium]
MKSGLEQLKKAASRTRKAKGPPVLSTSEARANFAEALETAQVDNAVIGFDRYGRTVAALVPVEAIYMLAGLGKLVDPDTRKEIESGAVAFAKNVPYRSVDPASVTAAVKSKGARAPSKSARPSPNKRRTPAAPARKATKGGKR